MIMVRLTHSTRHRWLCRSEQETHILPFDGLTSQHGEVFIRSALPPSTLPEAPPRSDCLFMNSLPRVTNYNTTHNMTLRIPGMYIHSPYFTMQ